MKSVEELLRADEMKRAKAKNLRYRKPLVKEINLEHIYDELGDIAAECDNIRYYLEMDDDTILNALDGDEDDAYEFRMLFCDLSAECEQMYSDLQQEYVPEYFDDFFAAVGAGEVGGGLLGYDTYEGDYFGLGTYESGLAKEESKKRMERLTKAQLMEAVGVCLKVLYAYLGIRTRYDSLKAAYDVLRDQNTGYLKIVKQIEEAYEKAAEDRFLDWYPSVRKFDELINALPSEAWIQ